MAHLQSAVRHADPRRTADSEGPRSPGRPPHRPKLGPYIRAVRDEVRNGSLLSDAFRQQNIFPKIYITTVMAGEKSGSLVEVLERYISYQKTSLAVRKKVMVSLMYPCVLLVLVALLMVFLITYVVPTFSKLYESMQATLPR